MNTPFRLDQHPRRQPLSAPPAGYFDQLPTRLMARVAPAAPRRSLLPAWLLQAPMYMRTGLASTLLLATFATSLWLGGSQPTISADSAATSLAAVPQEQLEEYLLTNEAHLDPADLAAAAAAPHALGITQQYLRPSASELTEALDSQPAEEQAAP